MLPKGKSPVKIYRASDDGRKASDFHKHCDGKGPTLTIIKTTNGRVFGGYSVVSWEFNGD